MIDRYHGIVFALDTDNGMHALELAQAVSPHVDAIKIGYQLILNTDLRILSRLRAEGILVPAIADLKITDAPHIVNCMAKAAFNAGYDAVTISAYCGHTALRNCVMVSESYGKDVIAFLEFTQNDALVSPDLANEAAQRAVEDGVYGILAPGTRPERVSTLRSIVDQSCRIFSCGIGVQGAQFGSAIRAGADFEIVGRAICGSTNPDFTARSLSSNLRSIIASIQNKEKEAS